MQLLRTIRQTLAVARARPALMVVSGQARTATRPLEVRLPRLLHPREGLEGDRGERERAVQGILYKFLSGKGYYFKK